VLAGEQAIHDAAAGRAWGSFAGWQDDVQLAAVRQVADVREVLQRLADERIFDDGEDR
jgi:hypothetical protein